MWRFVVITLTIFLGTFKSSVGDNSVDLQKDTNLSTNASRQDNLPIQLVTKAETDEPKKVNTDANYPNSPRTDKTANGTSASKESPFSTVHVVATVVGACVALVAVGLAAIFVFHKKRKMERAILRQQSFRRDSEDPSTPNQNIDPKPSNRISTVSTNYTNLQEQESASCSTIGSLNNARMDPLLLTGVSSIVSAPVNSYVPRSRRTINDQVDNISKRYSCPEGKLLQNQALSSASSQDSGFVSTTHIPSGSRLTLGSNISSSLNDDFSVRSLERTDSLKNSRSDIRNVELLKTRSLEPGMYGREKTATLRKLYIPTLPHAFSQEQFEFPETNLTALMEPFLKNPAKFRNKDGSKRTYATMSFAIGSFSSSGGVLSLPNRSVELIIPPHAVEKETVIYFSVVSHKQNKPKEISFGPEIDLGPDGTRFNCPVMLCFEHCSDVNENCSLKYRPMVQESDKPWRELTYDESMCTLVGNRACLFLDHFSRVKLVLKEGIEPDAGSIDENAELDDDKSDVSSVTTVVAGNTNDSSNSSGTTSSSGACACPDSSKHQDKGTRPKTLALLRGKSSSTSSLESSTSCSEKKKTGALVKVKRIIQNKLRPIGSSREKTKTATMTISLCCFVETCEQMIKMRVYYAATQGIIDDIIIKEPGNQATAPCSFIFRQGQGSLRFKLDTTNLEMYWTSQTAFEALSEEHILSNQYDHVEFTIKPTSVNVGLVKVFQSKRPHEKRKLNPTWGCTEVKALQAKHWLKCIDSENTDIVSHMLITRGMEPVEMIPRKAAIPSRLVMELCKILDPDERARVSLADSIGIDYVETKWILSRRSSFTKVVLTFFQGQFYKESSEDLLRKLFVHLKDIEHNQAADVVLDYLRGTSRLRGQSSSSQSSSENDVNNSLTSNSSRHPSRTNRCDSTPSTNSITSLSSINTSSSTIHNFGVNGVNRTRAQSDTDSGYSPSPNSPPVITSSVNPGVHIPYCKTDQVTYKAVNANSRNLTLATEL